MYEHLLYKGLQKPLEFMGVRGRFIYIFAAVFFGAFFAYIAIQGQGTMKAVLVAALIAVGGYVYILVAQKKGLHPKKRQKGLFIYHKLFKY